MPLPSLFLRVRRVQQKVAVSVASRSSRVIGVTMERSVIPYPKREVTLIKADRISPMYRATGQHGRVDADICLIVLSHRPKNPWI